MESIKLVNFLAIWVAQTIVLILASSVFGGNVVLGNASLTGPAAAILSGFLLTVLVTLARPVFVKNEIDRGFGQLIKSFGLKLKQDHLWALLFLGVNVIGLWIIKRLASVTGLGISNIVFVLIVAVVLTFAGWAAVAAVGALGKTPKAKR